MNRMTRLTAVLVSCCAALAVAAEPAQPSGSGKPAPALDAGAAPGGGSHCRVIDETGTPVVEHDSDGTTLKCQGEIREKVKALKCEPGKKLSYQYIGESAPGREGKPVAMSITCPKK